ncbi:hypothetical protein MHL31_01190 [Lutibacter sp. A80]|uniref:hypothetical protein n=1 Tax=Lutibacter sp. A80 TaxID=2918453 RepID=UPI001F0533C9|nr:hypothetical protein [Lutibacter sp. A80]UMB60843.1 hypothetical protein MHL31_01190 [Lutibacter sp. A80]
MRKMLTLLFVSALLLSCSKDDSISQLNTLNPPSWIQGTWVNDMDFELRFTSNDMYISDMSYLESNKSYIDSGVAVYYDESTSTEYTIYMKTDAVDMAVFEFVKISSTEIGMPTGVVVNDVTQYGVFKKK